MSSVASFSHTGKPLFSVIGPLLAGLFIVSGCSPANQTEQLFAEYQAQLSQALEQQPLPVDPQPMPVMPRANTLRSPIDEASISLLDSMRLDRCRAGALIAERNSALGRLRSPSARLYYEIDLMQALKECRQGSVGDNPRLNEALTEAITHKVEVLPQWIERVLTNSEELRSALRAHSSPLPPAPHPDAQSSLDALTYLADTFEKVHANPEVKVPLEDYRKHFRVLNQSDYLPRFWRTQQQALAWISSLNQQLEEAINKSTCVDKEQLQRVHLHYQTHIQPQIAEWRTTHAELKTQLMRMRDLSSEPRWQTYLNELAGELSHAEKVHNKTQVHNEKWNELFTTNCTNNQQTAVRADFLL
ncbi:DUF3080 family protein [Aliidiomarina minuta]|uniref:DUF3080 family protein n=1 Tax=Aliidiomarina minuta TaxID=880057 RepID=UPI0013006932|nr:DUF3080 family protein [Aliidiomarina minuta]